MHHANKTKYGGNTMKQEIMKFGALFMLSIFILSLVPVAFAKEGQDDDSMDDSMASLDKSAMVKKEKVGMLKPIRASVDMRMSTDDKVNQKMSDLMENWGELQS